MLVLVDTPIWSLALRRRQHDLNPSEKGLLSAFEELVREGRVQIVGAIRQELLSGIREEERFERLAEYLRAFEGPDLGANDYEEAARMSNRCRAHGVAGSAIDFLICAVAHRRKWQIFTTDLDFSRYAKVLPLMLYKAATQ